MRLPCVVLVPHPLRGCHPESGLLPSAVSAQTSGVTDTSTRPATAPTTWQHASAVRSVVELLLGLSFCATVAFGGYAAATGHLQVLAQVAAIVFVTTLVVVLVNWFRAVEASER